MITYPIENKTAVILQLFWQIITSSSKMNGTYISKTNITFCSFVVYSYFHSNSKYSKIIF